MRHRIHSISLLFMSCLLSVCLCMPAFADESASQVATSDEYGGREDIAAEGMVAVSGDEIADGTYDILVKTDTQMFNIIDCQLTVEDGVMTGVITLSSDGYQWVYMGTGEEAAAADSSEYVEYVENENGKYTYDIGEIPSLNTSVSCCCYSKRREQWYDHDIVFVAGTLPNDALSETAQQAVKESSPLYGIADGDYNIAVDVFGGEDTVESPVPMTIENGEATATLQFSSPNYDSLVMTGDTYEPVEVTADSATYELPIRVFDTSIPVAFNSVSSGAPEELAGSLSFHSGLATNSSGEKLLANAAEDLADAESDEGAAQEVEPAQSGNGSVSAVAIGVLAVAACVLIALLVFRRKANTKDKMDR